MYPSLGCYTTLLAVSDWWPVTTTSSTIRHLPWFEAGRFTKHTFLAIVSGLPLVYNLEMAPPLPSFTSTWHNDTYPAISPTRPELSAAGKTVIITGAVSGLTPQNSSKPQNLTRQGQRNRPCNCSGFLPCGRQQHHPHRSHRVHAARHSKGPDMPQPSLRPECRR